ncbi:siderophore-iron reductase FhuF [Microvirga makkahensis]|uniref:Siderophore-iron reductase FhuF n=1 Tax=Microvirga makkahensis TaxID=1128670 RepID=A0A7X3MW81_9HYPH|nr:siderophore-iron reductase FhuF [Microvirga makkahensis]MXQ14250.1 siderophore-iron reductase FhuF [Microvirga makkahensis]
MIHSLAPCFTGTFVRFKDGLALPGEHPSSIPCRDLLDAGVTEGLMDRFAEVHPGGDRRALVSMWAQWHFGALIIPTTAAIVFLDRDLPVALDQVSIALHEGGQTAAIVLPDDGASQRAGGTNRFARLFSGHVEPLIRHLADRFRVSPRMLWNNAADIFEWTLQQARADDRANPAALDEGRGLLESRASADGQGSPMGGLIKYLPHENERIRRRKLCCLRYLLPGVECCGGICPTPPKATR